MYNEIQEKLAAFAQEKKRVFRKIRKRISSTQERKRKKSMIKKSL